ncbi:MAG: nickel-dependent hydrogenase large subunit [Candidatus Bathyarchaeota archaeon]|nr:nickel-dependent hydrogenase large subunit [Candidatus Bathyarchaeota archaeon]
MGKREFTIHVGPQHPALKEPENFVFKVDGEYVVDVEPRIGYNHRGIEKAMENRTYIQNLYIVERVCGICSNSHQTCYTQNVEELLGMEIPERAKYIRVLLAELERIHSHLLWLGVAAHEIGFDTLFYYIWRDREVVMDMLEEISGNRVNYAMPTIGGVRRDIAADKIPKYLKMLDVLEERTKFYKNICATEKTVLARADGVGFLSKEDAIRLNAVGPNLRASGVASDIRADSPYLVYDEIPWNVISYDSGDVFANVLVRVDETFESVNICRYCLEHLPDGPIRTIFSPLGKVPEGEAVSLVEAPRGELIHYIQSRGTDKPYRYKIRAPTLGNIPALCEKLRGGYIADIPIVLAGIDPCFSCTDRMVFVDEDRDKRWEMNGEQLRRYGVEWYK